MTSWFQKHKVTQKQHLSYIPSQCLGGEKEATPSHLVLCEEPALRQLEDDEGKRLPTAPLTLMPFLPHSTSVTVRTVPKSSDCPGERIKQLPTTSNKRTEEPRG